LIIVSLYTKEKKNKTVSNNEDKNLMKQLIEVSTKSLALQTKNAESIIMETAKMNAIEVSVSRKFLVVLVLEHICC
jgi:hypothetical protein